MSQTSWSNLGRPHCFDGIGRRPDEQEDEDRKQHEHLADLVDRMQQKLRTFKKQIEEAEEIAAMNLAKFRKAQQETEEAEERADLSEQALAKYRAMGRGNTPNPGQLGML